MELSEKYGTHQPWFSFRLLACSKPVRLGTLALFLPRSITMDSTGAALDRALRAVSNLCLAGLVAFRGCRCSARLASAGVGSTDRSGVAPRRT